MVSVAAAGVLIGGGPLGPERGPLPGGGALGAPRPPEGGGGGGPLP